MVHPRGIRHLCELRRPLRRGDDQSRSPHTCRPICLRVLYTCTRPSSPSRHGQNRPAAPDKNRAPPAPPPAGRCDDRPPRTNAAAASSSSSFPPARHHLAHLSTSTPSVPRPRELRTTFTLLPFSATPPHRARAHRALHANEEKPPHPQTKNRTQRNNVPRVYEADGVQRRVGGGGGAGAGGAVPGTGRGARAAAAAAGRRVLRALLVAPVRELERLADWLFVFFCLPCRTTTCRAPAAAGCWWRGRRRRRRAARSCTTAVGTGGPSRSCCRRRPPPPPPRPCPRQRSTTITPTIRRTHRIKLRCTECNCVVVYSSI